LDTVDHIDFAILSNGLQAGLLRFLVQVQVTATGFPTRSKRCGQRRPVRLGLDGVSGRATVDFDLIRGIDCEDSWGSIGLIFRMSLKLVVESAVSSSAGNQKPAFARLLPRSDLTSADSGLQLDLEIALSGASSEGPAPLGFFSLVEDALKRRVT
jgi:hypothetical protein